MLEIAFSKMALQTDPGLNELEAEFTDVDAWEAHQLYGVGGEVPGLDTVTAQLN